MLYYIKMAVDYGKDLGKMVLGNHPLAGVIGTLIIYFIVLILILTDILN